MMWKEALLKPKKGPEDGLSTPTAQSPHGQDTAPSPAKLPSVEYFANFRGNSYDGASVTSTEYTARSMKGMTPSESWADDDDDFMQSVMDSTETLRPAPRAKPKSEKGWKEVQPHQGLPAREGRNRPKQAIVQTSVAPAPTPSASGGRFDALAPSGKRWR